MVISKSNFLRKNFNLIIFFLIVTCFYQIISVFFDYDLNFTYMIFYVVFILAIIFILADLFFNKFLIKKNHIVAFLFFCIIAFSIVFQHIFLFELFDISGKSGLGFVKSFAIGGLSWFVVGMAISQNTINKSNDKLSWLLMIILLTMFFMVLKDGFIIKYSELASGRGYDFYIDHLILGSFVLIIILFINSYISKNDLLFFLLSMFVFFMVGGRGDLIIFFVSFLIFTFIYNKLKALKYFLFIAILTPVIFLIFKMWMIVNSDDTFSRMSGILNISEDSSYLARLELFLSSFNGLEEQFLFGNPNVLILKNHPDPELSYSLGALSHNIVSVWQFYGFLAFCFCLYYLIVTTLFIKQNKEKLIDPISKFGVYLFIFTSLSIIFTKSITYYPFWLSMGFWIMRVYNFPMRKR